MKARGSRLSQENLASFGTAEASPGASHAPVIGNLAVQASLMQIFDEFTEVISGELKSMNLHEAGFPPDSARP